MLDGCLLVNGPLVALILPHKVPDFSPKFFELLEHAVPRVPLERADNKPEGEGSPQSRAGWRIGDGSGFAGGNYMGGGGRHNRNTLARAHEPMLTKVIVKLLTEDC